MLVRRALSRFGYAAMCPAVRTLGVLDPHFNALGQSWIAVQSSGRRLASAAARRSPHMPATWAVSRSSPRFLPRSKCPLGSDAILNFRHVIRGSLVFAFLAHT
jgi:hypothetical protein